MIQGKFKSATKSADSSAEFNEISSKNGDAGFITGMARRFALDTAAVLGGDETRVSNLYRDRCHQPTYNEAERQAVTWALGHLWARQEPLADLAQDLLCRDRLGQAEFDGLFDESYRDNICRILSRCLLYCGLHEDTCVIQNPADPRQRCIVINMDHYPSLGLPLGRVSGVPCNRLAVVYCKSAGDPVPNFLPCRQAVKLRTNLALQREMIGAFHFLAAVPVP